MTVCDDASPHENILTHVRMDDRQRRNLFWFGCVPARILIGFLALYFTFNVQTEWAYSLVGALTSVVAQVFLLNIVLFLLGSTRKGGFGGTIWWNDKRFVHFGMYTACAVTAFMRWPYSGTFLIADALLAIVFGTYHYFVRS